MAILAVALPKQPRAQLPIHILVISSVSGVSSLCQASVHCSHVPLALGRVTSPGLVLRVTVPCAWGGGAHDRGPGSGLNVPSCLVSCSSSHPGAQWLLQRFHLRLKRVQIFQPSGLEALSAAPCPVPMAITF